MKFLNSDRCKICKKRKGHRFCIRKESNICWQDCNKLRVDLKCPDSCKYAMQKNLNEKKIELFEYKTNADSQTEFIDLLKKEIDKWIVTPQKFLQDKSPLQLAETEAGKEQLTNLFNGFRIPEHIPMDHLKKRLDLEKLETRKMPENYEDTVFRYLDNVIAQEWQDLVQFTYKKEKFADQQLEENYLERIASDKILKKVKHYNLISSALSEDKNSALVYLELNGKFELTVVTRKIDNSWYVDARIYGKPELFNGENEAIKQVAILLSANKIAEVFPLLKKYTAIYPDSSDLHYYWGLYYTFAKNTLKAKEFFLNSVELDPDFLEAKYNYAFVLHSEKEEKKAEELYREILLKNPQDVRSLNNLASLLIDKGDNGEARELLEKCLQIDPEFSVAANNLERLDDLN